MPSGGQIFALKQDIGENSDLDHNEARSFLSEDELFRADRYQFDIHRFRFIRGRGFLRKIIAGLTDQTPNAIEFQYGNNGKPEIDHDQFEFNLSHSGDLAVLIYTFDLDKVGVDVELLERNVEFAGLSEHYFTADEQNWVLAEFLSPEEQKRRFFEIWTAKEARMKVFGEGLHLDPRAIHVEMNASQPTGYSAPTPTALPLKTMVLNQENAVASITGTSDFELEWLESKN